MRFYDDFGVSMDIYGLYILMFFCVEIVLFYIKWKKNYFVYYWLKDYIKGLFYYWMIIFLRFL